MTKCNTRSKTMQLHLINHAVFNSLNNNELLLAFEKQGISRSVFEDGKSIYEQAISARAAEIAIEDDLHEADMYLKKLQKSIHDEYIKFTEAAKMSFGRNTLDMLGIQKKLPRSETSLIDSAQKSIHTFNE
ncbi:MAG TPA: hypothetical protein VHO70_15005, partial [Chitinispirillaceae bacterium]|nr:hypothetical protein [Chitinispirillaceae bacterium]